MPLLGAVGGASEYSWRGTLDDWPNDFSFTNITNAMPGLAYTTGAIRITGINNRARVSVGVGFSVSVNGAAFSTAPQFIKNNDLISVQVQTTSGTDSDFFKTYSTNVRVGKKFAEWRIVTKQKDISPEPFAFSDSSNLEINTPTSSNIVTISGLEPIVPTRVLVTSGISSIKINGSDPVYSGNVLSGDTLQMVGVSSSLYDTKNATTVLVGTYSTTYTISTREGDSTVDQFSFTNVTNATPNVVYESNSITLTGADNNVEMTATIEGRGAFFQVQRVLPIVGLTTVKTYENISSGSFKVFNNDIITLKLLSTSDYSATNICTFKVAGRNITISADYSVTTRVRIVDTIPDRFKFEDLGNVDRDKFYQSNRIQLTGMTPGDEALATISEPGEFRVERLNSSGSLEIVKNYKTYVPTGTSILSPTYSIRTNPASNIIKEGTTVEFIVNTTLVPDNTTLYYTIVGSATTEDFANRSLTGSFVVKSNTGSFTKTLLNDILTEGPENFSVLIRTVGIGGTVVATSPVITIDDTSFLDPNVPVPQENYVITPAKTTVNEGDVINFNVVTTNVSDSVVLYYDIVGAGTSSITSADFSDNSLTGSFVVNSNFGTFTKTIRSDLQTEGSESFNVRVRVGSPTGQIVSTSSTIAINDTSDASPPQVYSIVPSATVVNEGSPVVFTVTTTNVPSGTIIFWNTVPVSGSIQNSDFIDNALVGFATVTNNICTIQRQFNNDSLTEGSDQFRIEIRTGSNSGPIVATSDVVTITDTSLTPERLKITLSGSSFEDGGIIPSTFRYNLTGQCNGSNSSPALSWSAVGIATTSVSTWRLRCVDQQASNFLHWSVNNIPSTLTSIAQNAEWPSSVTINSVGFPGSRSNGWAGPCPPPNTGTHNYAFTISAYDSSGVLLATSNEYIGRATYSISASPVISPFNLGMSVEPISAQSVLGLSTSTEPTYFITPTTGRGVYEGQSSTFKIETTNVPDGTTLYYSITGSASSADFTNGQLTGSFTINSNTATVNIPISSDSISEGTEYFEFNISTTSGGSIVASTPKIYILDPLTVSDQFNVRNGDYITLALKSSPASNGEVQTALSITGSDNRNLNSIFDETISDNWLLQSATRLCEISPFTLPSLNNVSRNTLQKTSFVVSGPAESDCNLRVSTSNQNSYLIVNGITGNNLPVGIGTTVEVYMTSGDYSSVRTTSVIILTANGNSTSAEWTITTIPDKTPVVRLTSSAALVPYGGDVELYWDSEYATSVSSNFGVGSAQTTGSLLLQNVRSSKIYTITAYGPEGGSQPSSVEIPAVTITRAQITASPTFVPYGGNVAVAWATQNADFVRSNFGAVEPSGQTLIEGLTGPITFSITGVGPSGESPIASVTVSTDACQTVTSSSTIADGVNASLTLGSNNTYYFNSLSGANVNNSMKTNTTTTNGNVVDFTTPGTNDWIVPSGVSSIEVLCIGGGGGGGTSINDTGTSGGGGGGGGGIKRGSFNVTPGQTIRVIVGAGGAGASGTTSSDTVGQTGSTSACGTISASGGVGGRSSDGGSGGSDNGESGQRMVSDTHARGGYGGGAGLLNGSNAGHAAELDSCTVCGGSGGNGASLTGIVGSSGVARVDGKRTGGNGGAYGGGGGGGSRRNRGGNGGNGAVRITYNASNITGGDSWSNVSSNIRSTFITRAGRPPSLDELRFWLNEYRTNSSLTLQTLISRITTSVTYSGSVTDTCGNTIN